MQFQRDNATSDFPLTDLDAFHAKMVAKKVPCLQTPQEEDFGGRLAGYTDPDGQPFWIYEEKP